MALLRYRLHDLKGYQKKERGRGGCLTFEIDGEDVANVDL
jgi:hypothetical protein